MFRTLSLFEFCAGIRQYRENPLHFPSCPNQHLAPHGASRIHWTLYPAWYLPSCPDNCHTPQASECPAVREGIPGPGYVHLVYKGGCGFGGHVPLAL